MELNAKAVTVPQPVFYLNNIIFLPHYYDPHMWVGPGDNDHKQVFHTEDLAKLNARLSVAMLWRRWWTDEIQGWNML